ncbi:ATP-binding protein [Nonomuraea sp. NPDC050202]|uniref:ATP-binding protein n=1 Tax=Nonomuraea sp. NPDC050202 TaxID=3155035 RepID=UPI0033EB19F2
MVDRLPRIKRIKRAEPHQVGDGDLVGLPTWCRRLHTTPGQGAGLGLSIVAAIAKAHGADVRASPHPGGGLELVVVFARSG